MKSSKEDLEKRGYINFIDITPYCNLNTQELFDLTKSSKATERTISYRLLCEQMDMNDPSFVTFLLECLSHETALYTRLEIAHHLENGFENTCKSMIFYLGKIGKNQYKEIPKRGSKKISYPLPRDLIARTIGKMSIIYLPILIEALNYVDILQLPELLDAIGFMIYYNDSNGSLEDLNKIIYIIETYFDNELIIWKSITCLSSFKLNATIIYLNELKKKIVEPTLLLEIDRSLNLMI